MGTVASHRDLFIWQRSMAVVKAVYSLCELLPRDERYILSTQMKRSAVSIPSNIAEGYCRYSKKDFSRFLRIALGSLAELQTQLELVQGLHNIGTEELRAELHEISKMTRAFIKTSTHSDL